MESTLYLEIVTPDKVVLSLPVDYVGVPGAEGEFGVLPNHIPMLSALAVGHLYFRTEGNTHHVFIAGGFAEISENKISILAESAERSEDIDVSRAEESKQRAEARIHAKSADTLNEKIDEARARSSLNRAIQRIQISKMSH